jgi:hypothetical protein
MIHGLPANNSSALQRVHESIYESGVYEGGVVFLEHRAKEQAVGLEIVESFILCGHQAFKMHIKDIAVFMH